MIFIESTIKISNNVSKMDSTIVLYRGDKNIEIRFTILQSPFKYSNTVATNVIESTNASFGQLVIKTPNDKPPIFSDVSATKEGTVLFTITKEMIDEIEEVGVYTFQIRLLDENKQSRGTIPPVENGIEIKEPIAIEDDNSTNVVGLAKANYAVATLSDVNTPTFDDNGKYNKTNWNDGDLITNASLNKIEDGIYTTNENVTATKKYVDDNKIACTISSKVLGTVPASTLKKFITPSDDRLVSPLSIANASINKDRRYYIEFLGSKKLCSLSISETNGNSIACSIGNYSIQAYNDSPNIAISITKINEDDTTATTFTDLIIYEEEVKYLDSKYLETDLVLQNSISLGRAGNIGAGSSAVGGNVIASGMGSHAEGTYTIASGYTSHAEGESTTASGMSSHTEGSSSTASGDFSHAEGNWTTASGMSSHAEGENTTASGDCSHAEGSNTIASGAYSHVQGKYNIEDTEGKYAHIVGNGKRDKSTNWKEVRSNAHTLDWQGNAWYSGKLSQEGTPTENKDLATKKYVDDNKIAYIKSETVAETIDTSPMISSFKNNSYIYESNNVTYLEIGKEYHVIVNGVRYRALCINNMPGNDQIYETIAVNGNGFSISIMNKFGYNTKYYPDNTKCAYEIKLSDELLAAPPTIQILKMDIEYIPTYLMPKDLGILNSISINRIGDTGTGSVAIGYNNTASNDFTFAMGVNTTASATAAHAEGGYTVANASYSHAEGFKSASTGEYSHVEGIVCESSGQGSHAEGYYTVASGQRGHSEGCFTEAASQYQHVQGKYNVVDSNGVYAHIVGNGTGKNNRHNAHTLDWQGNAWYSGKLSQEGAPIEDKDLATKKYVDDKIKDTLVTTNISGTTLALTVNKYQTATVADGTEITLPAVTSFTEIHLFFSTTTDLTLTLPACKWQNGNTPTILANKTYEFIFTYTTEWLGGVIVYE